MNCDLQFNGMPLGSRQRPQAGRPRHPFQVACLQAGAGADVPTQVVDISSKMVKMRVVSRLISRQLRRKQAFFDPFLTCKGVDFSALTENMPDFFKI
jgi:hypothetical protein